MTFHKNTVLKLKHNSTIAIVSMLIMFATQSCGIYSFTGAPITANTISIDYIGNKASIINPALSPDFTDALRDKFVNQTKLDLVEIDAELKISGTIMQYRTASIAIQGNEEAALNKLTITIKIKFENTMNEEESFNQNFTSFEQYDASKSFSSVEDQLVEILMERITQDIFNKALVNW